MFLASRFNLRAGQSLAIATAFACLLPSAATAAELGPRGHGPLSPALVELAEPPVASSGAAAQAARLDLPESGPGSLVREAGGRILVTTRFTGDPTAALDALREAGAQIVSSSAEGQTLTLAAAPEHLRDVAAVAGVRSVWPVRTPILYEAGSSAAAAAPCEGGSVVSEGLGQLRVDEARELFRLRGKGMTIGVLSDSFDAATEAPEGNGPPATKAADDVLAGDLPGPSAPCAEQQLPVHVLEEGPSDGASDEGRAMLQIVHDLAPHASLAFATAFKSEESFAQNIERLARPTSEGGAGADVIVDDVAWFEEPFFQNGPVAVAIEKVTAEGVTYLSAAGNNNLFDLSGREIASWEAPAFRDSGSCPVSLLAVAGLNGIHCLDFDPGPEVDRTFAIGVEAGATLTVDLQWAEAWGGVSSDLDAFVLSDAGTILSASVEENSGGAGTQRPVEIVQWVNQASSAKTVQLVVNRYGGATPRLKFILLQNGGGVNAVEYPQSSGGDVVGPTIFGHAGAADAVSVAAVPYGNGGLVERYSSRGPVTHLFGPVEGAIPASALPVPEVLAKPDLAASDCVATSFFSFFSDGAWRFCGTSAAAPHAAAVAALLHQAKPNLPQQQIRAALVDSATPVGTFPPEAIGGGLVDAVAALSSLPGPIDGQDLPSGSLVPAVSPMPSPTPGPSPAVAGGGSSDSPVSPRSTGGPKPLPITTILRHPAQLVRTRAASARLLFRFGSDGVGATFLCKIDASRYRSCPSRLVRRFRPGRHRLAVVATDALGQVDPTPAIFRFRVRRLD
jgi:hypothetical protein